MGDIGTILLVLAIGWGAWTFFLSPDAEVNRDIGGGLFGIATKDTEAVDKMGKRLVSGLEGIAKYCPMCKTGYNPECQKCADRNRSKILGTMRSANYGGYY